MSERGRPPEPPPAEARRARAIRLLDILYGGNQRRASRVLNISQAHILKLVHGQRPVTDHVLQVLADQPGVNPRWLFDGDGEPLLPLTAGTVAVAAVLLPGPPRQFPSMLTGALSRGSGNGSGNLLRPAHGRQYCTGGLRQQLSVMSEDMLLIETDRAYLDRLDIVAGHLCAVRLAGEGGDLITLAQILVDGDNLYANIFAEDQQSPAVTQAASIKTLLASHHRRSITRRPQQATDDDDVLAEEQTSTGSKSLMPPSGAEPTHKTTALPESWGPGGQQQIPVPNCAAKRIELLDCENIVGVAIRLERPLISMRRD